jgi:HlyD family secretion protein
MKKLMKILGTSLGIACLVALIVWSGGFLATGLIDENTDTGPLRLLPEPEARGAVSVEPVMEHYEAVGTVRPRVETKVQSQVQAKVLEVLVSAGQQVSKGDLLVLLDSRELESRLEQARQGLENAQATKRQAQRSIDAAQASFSEAKSQYERIKSLYAKKAVASSEMDEAEAAYLKAEASLSRAREELSGAEASVRQAREKVEEAEISLSYARIEAHEAGEVAGREVEPGDLAVPGQPLLHLQTSGSLRLEALVRETLINRVRPGTELEVELTAQAQRVPGVVEEIVPSGDPRTRTFLVKVGLPPLSGVYPGMFGRLLVPVDAREAVLAPRAAIRRTGQIETVDVLDTAEGREVWRSVFVKTGQKHGEKVEILSGLSGGEVIGLPEALEAPLPENQDREGGDAS